MSFSKFFLKQGRICLLTMGLLFVIISLFIAFYEKERWESSSGYMLLIFGISCIIIGVFVITIPKGQALQNNTTPVNNKLSYFDGGLFSYFGWKILGWLITILTLGICYPWAICMSYGWKINHTVINGKRLRFTGKAVDLFLHWLLWWFLSIITLGIYLFWLFISIEKWRVKHTIMIDLENTTSTPSNNTPTSTNTKPKSQKECKGCGKMIDSDYTACPHCGGDDFDTASILLNTDIDLNSIRALNHIKEEKKCKRCGKKIDSDYASCPHCGGRDFE
ncbi:hypothetical protein AGMMS49991_06260 [Spirochaetia bacterium]|nr:hypothetical protein AGMMS49991_06260 [Spirochaetia bacterium]